MFVKQLKNGIRILKSDGILALIIKILKLIAFKILSISVLYIYELDLSQPVKQNFTSIELSFRVALEDDIDSLNNPCYGYDKQGNQYSTDRYRKGDKCILAIHHDKIVGYGWIMKDNMELSQFKHISIAKNRVYFYKGFILEEFRGKRVLNSMDMYLIDQLKKNGKLFWVTTIDRNNMSSIKARERLGCKKIGTIIQLRIFGLKYDYLPKKNLLHLQKQ